MRSDGQRQSYRTVGSRPAQIWDGAPAPITMVSLNSKHLFHLFRKNCFICMQNRFHSFQKTSFTQFAKRISLLSDNWFHSFQKTGFTQFEKPISVLSENWFHSFQKFKFKHVWNVFNRDLILNVLVSFFLRELNVLVSGVQIYIKFQKQNYGLKNMTDLN